MTMEDTKEEERVEAETESEVKHILKKTVCADSEEREGSWLRAVTALIIEDGDYSQTSDIHRLAKNLIDSIPVMGESAVWIKELFHGDDKKFHQFLKSSITSKMTIDLSDPAGAMLCAATAKQLSRIIKIHTVKSLKKEEETLVFDGGLDSKKRKVLEILLHNNRFWALSDIDTATPDAAGADSTEDVNGMQGPSQSLLGKYRIHKKKGPTLPVKGKNAASKARIDEKRRRDEKAKTEKDIKIDAMNDAMDVLRADCGDLKNKLRQMEDYGNACRKYIMSLEIRFSDLCTDCKSKTPETAFTSSERASIMHIVKLLEDQQKQIDLLVNTGAAANNNNIDAIKEPAPAEADNSL